MLEDISNGQLIMYAVSGKIASGKDTVAQSVNRRLQQAGHAVAPVAFADALKDELTDVIATAHTATPGRRIIAITELLDAPWRAAAQLADILIGTTPETTGWDRHPSVRAGLQRLADLRRSTYRNWWVDLALADAVDNATDNTGTVITDLRQHNEARALHRLGVPCVRLHVTAAEQQRRLQARTGQPVDPNVLTHSSETELDDYDRFDLIVDNSRPLGQVAEEILSLLLSPDTRQQTQAA